MRPVVSVYNLGRTSYLRALNFQKKLHYRLKQKLINSEGIDSDLRTDQNGEFHAGKTRINSLILVEHDPVYTIGIRRKEYNDDYLARLTYRLKLSNVKAEFVETNRGGLITFHGPGQLVAYPIINLGDFTHSIQNRSVRSYVNLLENTMMETLTRIGINGAHTVKEYPGVWVANSERKIAFVGISCKRFVTMHGISINCDCDLSWFEHIESCGIPGDKKITSIKKEITSAKFEDQNIIESSGSNINGNREYIETSRTDYEDNRWSVSNVSSIFCSVFSQKFNCDLIDTPATELIYQEDSNIHSRV